MERINVWRGNGDVPSFRFGLVGKDRPYGIIIALKTVQRLCLVKPAIQALSVGW